MRRFRSAVATILTDPLAEPRLALAVWGVVAAVSLAFAAWLATGPSRSRDFLELRSWIDAWGFGAANPYDNAGLNIDYPPHALLLLAPLGWLPARTAALWFAPISVALSVAAVWLSVTVTMELAGLRPARRHVWILTAVVLSWGAIRTSIWLGQTMPIALALSLLSVRWAARRPLAAGAALGLSTFKPNLAIGFVVALALLRRVWPFAGAVVIIAVATTAFAWSVHESPVVIVETHLRRLVAMYGYAGPGHLRDWIGVRALLYEFGGNAASAVAAYYGFLVVSLGLLVWLTARATPGPSARALVFAGALVWTLTAFSQQRFNVVLLAPAFVLLCLPEVRLVAHEGARRWTAGLVVLSLSMDWPLDVRLVGEHHRVWLPTLAFLARLLGRVPVLTLLVVVFWRLFLEGRPDSASTPAQSAADSPSRAS